MEKEIEKIKEEIEKYRKDVVILAHNYQYPEIQEIADFVGDSLELCRAAQNVDKKYILFCGVDFMAESAAILNPDKIVLIPDMEACCPMAAMLTAKKVKEAKKKHKDAKVVVYINSLAEARALSDATCTSANAIEVVKNIDSEKIIFGPDANLAWHVARNLPEKEIIPLPAYGRCRVHVLFDREHIIKAKMLNMQAEILAHPECKPEVQVLADKILSTGQMLKHAKKSNKKSFIIATETGLIYRLKKENPDKDFIPALDIATCINMKKHTLDKVLKELKERKNVIKVSREIAEGARKSLEKMFELAEK